MRGVITRFRTGKAWGQGFSILQLQAIVIKPKSELLQLFIEDSPFGDHTQGMGPSFQLDTVQFMLFNSLSR